MSDHPKGSSEQLIPQSRLSTLPSIIEGQTLFFITVGTGLGDSMQEMLLQYFCLWLTKCLFIHHILHTICFTDQEYNHRKLHNPNRIMHGPDSSVIKVCITSQSREESQPLEVLSGAKWVKNSWGRRHIYRSASITWPVTETNVIDADIFCLICYGPACLGTM